MKNKFFHPDKKLADRGWAALRATLDREMPVRRRRRFAWLWWLLVPALLAGSAGAWFFQGNRAMQPRPGATQKHEAPVADARRDAIETAKSRPAPAPTAPVAATTIPRTADARAQKPRPVAPAAPSTIAAQAVPAAASIPPRRPESVENELITSNSTVPASLVLLPREPAALRLPALDPPALALQNIAAAPGKRPTPAPSPWAFGLTAGASARDFGSLSGLTAGVTADLRLGQKWGLRSGLAYGYERLPQKERISVSAPAVVHYDTLGFDTTGGYVIVEDVVVEPSGTANAFDSTGQVIALVTNVHRLELPLLLWWQPFRQWRVYGGGSLARTLTVRTGGHRVFVNQNQIEVNQFADPQNRLDQLAAREIPTWQASLLGGVGFRPSRHFEFDFFAQNLPRSSSKAADHALYDPTGSIAPASVTKSGRPWRFHLTASYFF